MPPRSRQKKKVQAAKSALKDLKLPQKPPQDQAPFSIGEIVWCNWKDKYYRAKILKIIPESEYISVHFWKFAKSWDMPVNKNSLIRFNSKANKIYVKNFNAYQHKKSKEIKKNKRTEE